MTATGQGAEPQNTPLSEVMSASPAWTCGVLSRPMSIAGTAAKMLGLFLTISASSASGEGLGTTTIVPPLVSVMPTLALKP